MISDKKYDVAFAPVNPRLLDLSSQFCKLLEGNEISSTILKTSLISESHNGWDNAKKANDFKKMPLTLIDDLSFIKKSNFFTYSYRVIKSSMSMRKSYEPNFRSLIVFMDDFAEAEILIPIMKKKNIPVILFQEGFFVDENQYHFDLYGIAKYLRSMLLGSFFTKNKYGANSDYIFTWSSFGFMDYLTSINVAPENIKILGNPNSIQKEKMISRKPYKNILINHSPLAPRFSSQKWEDNLWTLLIKMFDDKEYNLSFKPHPRVGFTQISNLLNNAKVVGNYSKLKILDKNIPAEKLYLDHDVLINIFSASSFEALYIGMPVVFIKSEYNNVKLLDILAKNNEIIMVDEIHEIPNIINKLNSDFDYRNKVIKLGKLAAEKLAGELDIFDKKFPLAIKNILKINLK